MRRLAGLLLTVSCSGCHILLPYTAERGPSAGDARRVEDDARGRDGRWQGDADRERPLDARTTERTPLADLRLLLDAAAGDGGAMACPASAQASPAQVYTPGPMVLCAVPAAQKRPVCDAGSLCNSNAGWTPCTLDQFLARGGQTEQAVIGAWLAACFVHNGVDAYDPPTSTVCPSCAPATAFPLATVAYACGKSNPVKNDFPYMAALAGKVCHGLDPAIPVRAGNWEPVTSMATLSAAVCCR